MFTVYLKSGGALASGALLSLLISAGVSPAQNAPSSQSYESLVARRPDAATPAVPRPLVVPSGAAAFAVLHGIVFATEDGGKSWQRRGTLGDEAVAATTAGPAWRCLLRSGQVVSSADGGRTWSSIAELRVAEASTIVCGGFGPDGSAWASVDRSGRPVVLVASADGVRTLEGPRGRVGSGWRGASAIVTASTGGEVYRAAEGAQLERVVSLQGATLNDISFADDQRGWIATGEGNVLETHDGGTSWLPRPVAGASALDAVGLAGDAFWVVGRAGANGVLYVSRDGGVRWRNALTGTAPLSRPAIVGGAAWIVDGAGGVWTAPVVDGAWQRAGALDAKAAPAKRKGG